MTAFLRCVCWRLCAATLGFSGLLVVAADANSRPGDLDPTFGEGGRVFINMDANAEAAASLLQQPDGKLLIGRATNLGVATTVDLSVLRLNSAGKLDATFGGDGVAATDLPGITASTKTIVQQGFGRIVAAGRAWRDDDASRGFFAIARYLPDGTLDSTFGSGGFVLEDFGAPRASIDAVVVQPDGKLLVAGNVEPTPGVTNSAFSRFNANGSIDATFGQNGRLILDVEGAEHADSAYALMRRSDGGLIAAVAAGDADGHRRTVLLSLTAEGNVDSSFGSGGRVTLDPYDEPDWDGRQVGLQSDGKIVIAWLMLHRPAGLSCDLHLSRLDGSGHLDPTFGISGFQTVALSTCYVLPRLVVASDDSILFSAAPIGDDPWGYSGFVCPCAPLVLRVTANGAPDVAFGVNGAVGIDMGVDDILSNVDPGSGTYLTQQADGNITIASTGWYDHDHTPLNGAILRHSGIAVARLRNGGVFTGLIGFQADVLPIPPESPSSVRLVVQRTGGSAGAVSVHFATSNGTAVGGSDYAPNSGTLTWGDGDSTDRVITIAILDDLELEDFESLGVTLSSPTGGAFLATSRSTVFIQSSDPAPPPVAGPPGSSTGGSGSGVGSGAGASSGSGGGGAVDWVSTILLLTLLAIARRRNQSTASLPLARFTAPPRP